MFLSNCLNTKTNGSKRLIDLTHLHCCLLSLHHYYPSSLFFISSSTHNQWQLRYNQCALSRQSERLDHKQKSATNLVKPVTVQSSMMMMMWWEKYWCGKFPSQKKVTKIIRPNFKDRVVKLIVGGSTAPLPHLRTSICFSTMWFCSERTTPQYMIFLGG